MSGLMLAVALAGSAAAARFKVSVEGTDTLTWNVAQRGDCGRSGSGLQSVRFRAADPHPVAVSEVRVRHGGKTIRLLRFGRLYALNVNGQGTVRRQDDTTGSYPVLDGCQPIGPKDCGTKPLSHPGAGGDDRPGFVATIWSAGRDGLALEAQYWGAPASLADAPFLNCMALATPTPIICPHIQFYYGWKFGDELLFENPLFGEYAPAARTVPLASMKIGRTYDFAVQKNVSLTDSNVAPCYILGANGGSGGPDFAQDQSPGAGLGSDRSMSDRVIWHIMLKRVS